MHSSYRSSFAKKRLPLKEITSHGGAIIFLPTARLLYIYRTSSLTDRERSRTKKKGEPSQSQDNLPLKTFAKPRQRDRELCSSRCQWFPLVVYSSWKSRRRAFTSSPPLFRHFLMHRTRRTSQRIEEASFFHPLPFHRLCPNSTLPLPSSLVFFETQKNR